MMRFLMEITYETQIRGLGLDDSETSVMLAAESLT
jgi:hypothetical protein